MKNIKALIFATLLVTVTMAQANSSELIVEIIKPCFFETEFAQSQQTDRAGTDLHLKGVVCVSKPGSQCQSQPSHGGDYITASFEDHPYIGDIDSYANFHDETTTIEDGQFTEYRGKVYLCSDKL